MLGPTTCAACGAKIREDRTRCLRCGVPLHASSEPGQDPLTRLAMAAGGVAVVAFVALLIARPAPRVMPAAQAVVRTVAASPVFAARALSADNSRASADAALFTSMDVSRDALAAYERGDEAASLARFQAAVEAAPDNADALNNLGQLLVRTGRARDALQYFDRAIQAADTVWTFHFNRARAYAQLEQWRAAISGYRDAARLFPDDYVTEFNLAKALQANGDLDAAIAGFERAIALAPGQADFHLSHGVALEAAKRPADAAAAYRRYLELEEAAPAAEKIKERIAALVP